MSTLAPIVELTRPDQGRRYSPAEREVALMIYMGEGKQNMTRTAQLTGVSRFTLMKWADQDDWQGRIDGAGSAVIRSVELAYAFFPHLLRAASSEWLRLLTDPKTNDHAKVKLIEMAYGMHGMIVPKQSHAVVQHITGEGERTTVSVKDLAELDPDTLAAWSEGSTDEGEEQEGEG